MASSKLDIKLIKFKHFKKSKLIRVEVKGIFFLKGRDEREAHCLISDLLDEFFKQLIFPIKRIKEWKSEIKLRGVSDET